jgi:hypothetical protein
VRLLSDLRVDLAFQHREMWNCLKEQPSRRRVMNYDHFNLRLSEVLTLVLTVR